MITGGASGIGAASVRHHVQRGDTVIVLDLASAWSEQKANTLGAHAFYECDVQNDQRLRELGELIEAEHGPVDNLITSADGALGCRHQYRPAGCVFELRRVRKQDGVAR